MADVIDFDAARAALGRNHKPSRAKEDKRARFKRVAGKRIDAINARIDILSRIASNWRYYQFSKEDVDLIIAHLHRRIEILRSRLWIEFHFGNVEEERLIKFIRDTFGKHDNSYEWLAAARVVFPGLQEREFAAALRTAGGSAFRHAAEIEYSKV